MESQHFKTEAFLIPASYSLVIFVISTISICFYSCLWIYTSLVSELQYATERGLESKHPTVGIPPIHPQHPQKKITTIISPPSQFKLSRTKVLSSSYGLHRHPSSKSTTKAFSMEPAIAKKSSRTQNKHQPLCLLDINYTNATSLVSPTSLTCKRQPNTLISTQKGKKTHQLTTLQWSFAFVTLIHFSLGLHPMKPHHSPFSSHTTSSGFGL
jgi:hypothetical protein